jgi:hypothetical protein
LISAAEYTKRTYLENGAASDCEPYITLSAPEEGVWFQARMVMAMAMAMALASLYVYVFYALANGK